MDSQLPPKTDVPIQPPPLLGTLGPPPRRRRHLWWLLALGLCVVLVAGLAAVVWRLDGSLPDFAKRAASGYHSHGPRMEEVTLECAETENKIVVIPVEGIIMSESLDRSGRNMVELIEEQLKRAADDAQVKAVILKVDSPGGEVLASDEIYHLLADFQEKHDVPVVASMGSLAASGGYYVSAPCRWIVANKLTLTGSIGVIMSTLNYRGLMDKVGLRPEVFKSGQFKDMLRGSKQESEITQQERDMIQNLVNEAFNEFKQVVGEGRRKANERNRTGSQAGQPLATNWVQFADGRVLTGREACRLGFVDELGNFQTAVKRAKKLADINKANLIRYREVFDFANVLRLFGKSQTPTFKVDVGLELPKVKSGQMYYLTPAFAY